MAKTHGIDYGSMHDKNRDKATGIRYGIVSQHDLEDWFFEIIENEYDSFCPKCGEELDKTMLDSVDPSGPCPHCDETIERDDTWGAEPSRTVFDSDGVKGFVNSSGDVWVISSPIVTPGTHCSPCAPGAMSVGKDSVHTDAVYTPLAYTLPPSWFREDTRPDPKTFFRADSDDHTAPVPYVESP